MILAGLLASDSPLAATIPVMMNRKAGNPHSWEAVIMSQVLFFDWWPSANNTWLMKTANSEMRHWRMNSALRLWQEKTALCSNTDLKLTEYDNEIQDLKKNKFLRDERDYKNGYTYPWCKHNHSSAPRPPHCPWATINRKYGLETSWEGTSLHHPKEGPM